MTPTALNAALAVAMLVGVCACESTELPAISAPELSITDDDRDVLKAVLDQVVRRTRDRMIELGRANPRESSAPPSALILLFDSTVAWCAHGPIGTSFDARGCIGPHEIRLLRDPASRSGVLAQGAFATRNSRSMSIVSTLGDDVVLVPSVIARNQAQFHALHGAYPAGSAIVSFSAPAYINASAVVFYRYVYTGGGFVHLARRDGQWVVTASNGWTE